MRADGHFCGVLFGAAPLRRRRVVHSVMTRRLPGKPLFLRRRQSSAPFRQPSAHSLSRVSSLWFGLQVEPLHKARQPTGTAPQTGKVLGARIGAD
jgi:hypothetical protein